MNGVIKVGEGVEGRTSPIILGCRYFGPDLCAQLTSIVGSIEICQ